MKKILAIDDQKNNLITIKAVIEDNIPDCKVLTALSGNNGIEIARKEQPDTILLDIIMSKMDGYEVCKRLKADEITKHIPVILITAIKIDTESRIKGLNIGADAFLSKPIDPAELSAQVNVMLRIKEAEDKLRAEKEQLDQKINERIKELQKSEDKYRVLFETAKDAIFLSDETGRFIDVNQAACESLGYNKKELLKLSNRDIDADPRGFEAFRKIRDGLAENINFEVNQLKKDGTLLPVEITRSFFTKGDQKISLAIARDITKRKQAKGEIQLEQGSLRNVLESMGDGAYIVDQQYDIKYANSALIKDFGNYKGKKCYGYLHDREDVCPWCKNPDVFAGKTVHWEWYSFKNQKTYDLIETLLKNSDGSISKLEIFRNITERKKAEEALRKSETKYRLLAENTIDCVWKMDKYLKFTYVNQISFSMLGFTQEEWIGSTLAEHCSKKELQHFMDIVEDELRKKDTYSPIFELNLFHKDGRNIPLEVMGKILFEKNKEIIGFQGNARDITERKKAEEELKTAYLKAAESDRLKSAFLATMSHELRTPLNAVIGFSDIINEGVPMKDIVMYNKTINSSGKHLLSIVEDIFDITLIESGQINITKEDVRLQSILNDVQEIIQMEQFKLNKAHLNLKLMIPPAGKDLIIHTDASKLKQILINLLKNALKFTHTGHIDFGYSLKTITEHRKLGVEASRNTVAERPVLSLSKERRSAEVVTEPVEVEFFVKDTGIGIPEDKKEYIFESFRQIEETYTKTFGGAGIGLSISKKLIELLAGKIWLKSKLGKGSTFYFTIPYEKSDVAKKVIETETKNEIKNQLKNKTILIVEDAEPSYKFLRIVLKKSGINTLWAKDGEESIKLCKENSNIDLVLMDINMPIINGYEATKEIKKFKPDLPIIAQTACAIAGDWEKSLEAGCNDYISKPIKKDELMAKIEKFL